MNGLRSGGRWGRWATVLLFAAAFDIQLLGTAVHIARFYNERQTLPPEVCSAASTTKKAVASAKRTVARAKTAAARNPKGALRLSRQVRSFSGVDMA